MLDDLAGRHGCAAGGEVRWCRAHRAPAPGSGPRACDKKAGNLRHAFTHTSAEFIAIFDADFCPVEDYLHRLLPFLLDDPRLAIVQTPQFFTVEDHTSWVGRGSANAQELFYRLIQVNRNSFNAAICVGTCAVYRRKALEPFGGTALVLHSEDMRTGFNCIRLGWRIRYIPYNLAKGLCPDDLNGFINQQYRWTLGSMSLCFNREFWGTPLGFMQRMCYLSGMMYYIITGIGLFLTFVPISLILIFAPDLTHWYNIFFTIPSILYTTFIYSRWTRTTWGLAYAAFAAGDVLLPPARVHGLALRGKLTLMGSDRRGEEQAALCALPDAGEHPHRTLRLRAGGPDVLPPAGSGLGEPDTHEPAAGHRSGSEPVSAVSRQAVVQRLGFRKTNQGAPR